MEAAIAAKHRGAKLSYMQCVSYIWVARQSRLVLGSWQEGQCMPDFPSHLWTQLIPLKPELTVQTIRMPVQVYSGIAPPAALLAAMSNRPSRTSTHDVPPPTPSRPSAQGGGLPAYSQPPSTQATDHIEPSPSDIPPDAPPSYEDAIADNMGPIDGPRMEYRPNEARDDKSGGRLFQEGGA